MKVTKRWDAEVRILETEETTEATVVLDMGDVERTGRGRARRNPDDPDVPRIGEELAVARALSDLSHRLVDDAGDMLQGALGRPVDLTR